MNKKLTFLLALAIMCLAYSPQLLAQQQVRVLDAAYQHIASMADQWNLEKADYADMIVSDEYQSKHMNVTHVYFVQRYKSIPVFAAINGVHLNEAGEVVFATNNFHSQLESNINTSSPSISAEQALRAALAHLKIDYTGALQLKNQTGNTYLFAGAPFANTDVEVKLSYMPIRETGEIRLAWDMAIDMASSADYWSIRMDATDASFLHKNNWTLYCSFGDAGHADHCAHQETTEKPDFYTVEQTTTAVMAGEGSYRVFPLPAESPIHGDRELVVDPHSVAASPYGWHDTNGEVGPEYRITRGNNVHAYLDEQDNNSSAGDEPEGDEDMVFDFFFAYDAEPQDMKDAAVTQLFYMVNMMHDITFAYGFDEAGGNFQRRNYSGEGQGSDHVLAEAQDGSGTNNANFSTPPEGSNGRMQMYLWDGVGGKLLSISEPSVLAADYETGTASYGPPVSTTPIEAEIVRAYDATGSPFIVCEDVANASEVEGKIAMIDRGFCFFEEKTLNAEAAGAVAVIICNYEETAMGMSGGVDGQDPTIPTISLKASDCAQIKAALEQGETVMGSIGQAESNGPAQVDGDFDNGIIAHEFGHGISNRLTGGPSAAGCLGNDEQMGEGWSDFFTLITTAKAGDTGDMPRGIGNYADRKEANGTGIRRQRYSTDFTVNNQTYDDVIATGAPHPLGEVWVSIVWDLYWALVDEYGFDEDVINGTGGNNIAIQLVMDGMKLQTCSPGFVSGRDAIISADYINNDGDNACLIWEVFARRGVGFYADEGSRFDRNDGSPDFTVMPECVKELKVVKTADRDLITAGDEIEYTLDVYNHKETAVSGVMVNDELPQGLTYVAGSASGASVTDNGSSLNFEIGAMEPGDHVTITYTVMTDAEIRSTRLYFDGMEEGLGDANWEYDVASGIDIWGISSDDPYEGNQSWFIPAAQAENDQRIVLPEPFVVEGDAPVVRFYHKYDVEAANDGGLVEISTDNGFSWEFIEDKFIRNGYRGRLASRTLFNPNVYSFWGNSEEYIDSYIDLSSYSGQEVLVRFRYASNADDEQNPVFATGWFMDNFEVMDMIAYQGEACVTSNEGDMGCAQVAEAGVVVDSDFSSAVIEPANRPDLVSVYPNPASNVLNVSWKGDATEQISNISLINAAGALVKEWSFNNSSAQNLNVNVSDLAAGFYVVSIKTAKGIYTEKITIQ